MGVAACKSEVSKAGREIAEHGTEQFPAACYRDDLNENHVPWHWHDELEAAVVIEGEVVVSISGSRFLLQKGEGFFVNAGVLHAAWKGDCGDCVCHSIVYHPRLIGGGIESVFWEKYIRPLVSDGRQKGGILRPGIPWQQEAIRHVEEAWQACAKEPEGYEFLVRNSLSGLILQIILNGGGSPEGRSLNMQRRNERLKAMLQFMSGHLGEELSVGRIAESAAVSESECLRCFRTVIGTSPMKFLRILRVQRSAELLLSTDLKISDLAAQCGFQDMSYFAKVFGGVYGCSPSEYRREGYNRNTGGKGIIGVPEERA